MGSTPIGRAIRISSLIVKAFLFCIITNYQKIIIKKIVKILFLY